MRRHQHDALTASHTPRTRRDRILRLRGAAVGAPLGFAMGKRLKGTHVIMKLQATLGDGGHVAVYLRPTDGTNAFLNAILIGERPPMAELSATSPLAAKLRDAVNLINAASAMRDCIKAALDTATVENDRPHHMRQRFLDVLLLAANGKTLSTE